MAKHRVAVLRAKLSQIVASHQMNLDLEGANDQFKRAMLAQGDGEAGSLHGPSAQVMHELIRLGFNAD